MRQAMSEKPSPWQLIGRLKAAVLGLQCKFTIPVVGLTLGVAILMGGLFALPSMPTMSAHGMSMKSRRVFCTCAIVHHHDRGPISSGRCLGPMYSAFRILDLLSSYT